MHLITNGCDAQITLSVAAKVVNLNPANHLELIRSLLLLSDEALFVSPFLFDDFGPLFTGLTLNMTKVELISTCAPRGDDQFRKPFSLRDFGSKVKSLTGSWPMIGIDQALHSKVYVFLKGKIPFAGVVTSANLTISGLTKNHETGLLITDTETLERLQAETRRHLDYVNLTEYQIDQLCSASESMANLWKWKKSDDQHSDIGLSNILNTHCTPSAGNRNININASATYYIKVSGVSDRPVLPKNREARDEPYCELEFAKPPANIRLGDCLIEVAVGGACFLSYYACASAVFERTANERRSNPDKDRWPFYVFANNLALHYGSVWFEKPIFYNDVVNAFKKQHPQAHVTRAGNDHFVGAMQMGHSYIPVTKEFGEFVRKEIDAFNLGD
ncbi:restriction endonuclease PLD domain-containing protein [Noviherbaspirillum sp.]|uniref:restriction endonuclease PLD domain-containing protein n=1 Tax=Noviherbaspirillum sp. TaxID=1926288 RepID=UPI002FDFEECA